MSKKQKTNDMNREQLYEKLDKAMEFKAELIKRNKADAKQFLRTIPTFTETIGPDRKCKMQFYVTEDVQKVRCSDSKVQPRLDSTWHPVSRIGAVPATKLYSKTTYGWYTKHKSIMTFRNSIYGIMKAGTDEIVRIDSLLVPRSPSI